MKIFRNSLVNIGLIGCLLSANNVFALKIVVNQGKEGSRPIVIVPFQGENKHVNLSKIISKDLEMSGFFRPVSLSKLPAKPSNAQEIQFNNWRALSDTVVVGSLIKSGNHLDLKVDLIDVYRKYRIGTFTHTLTSTKEKYIRKVAHKISDIIYQKLTGKRGIFTTKLVYVTVDKSGSNRLFSLNISGVDGKDSQSIFQSYKSILSPAWSPDGRQIAFVSFENNKAEIWVKDLHTNLRRLVLQYKGNISSPSFSPDGNKLAVTLVKDGNAEIYIMNLVTKIPKRITFNKSVDTEATWSPDGKSIYFLSDRYKKQAQIYKVDITGETKGRAKRVTHVGKYNTSPDISSDLTNLVMLHRKSGRYQIAIQNLFSKKFRILSKTDEDEAPSFSPNSEMIVYASKIEGQGVIAITNRLGNIHQIYSSGNKDVREPAWSPYLD